MTSYKIVKSEVGLELHAPPEKKFKPLILDFNDYKRLFRKSEADLLKKAIGKLDPGQAVLEATLGLAHDGFRLAGYGHMLISIEENPIVFQLVEDALNRYRGQDASVLKNWEILNLRAQTLDAKFMRTHNIHTIYLDPMFPESKAASGKDSQILQDLCDTNPNSIQNLVDWAFCQPVSKVVIKRLRLAKPLKDKFSNQLAGKTIRWDIYARPKISASTT